MEDKESVRVELLSDGSFEIDGGMLVYGVPAYYGRTIKAHLKPLLIETGDELILVDTGIGRPPERISRVYNVRKETDLMKELDAKNISPDEITMVINTHLHFDHTGYNRKFKGARFIVQEEELRYSASPDRFQKGGYLKENLEGIEWTPLRGEKEVAPGVTVLPTPGHTPGHQSVIVETDDEVIVYTGDVAPLDVNMEKKYIVGILHDPVEALRSLDRLEEISEWWPDRKKRFITSHQEPKEDT